MATQPFGRMIGWSILLGAAAFATFLAGFMLLALYLVFVESGSDASVSFDIWRTVVGTGFAVAASAAVFGFVALRWVAPRISRDAGVLTTQA